MPEKQCSRGLSYAVHTEVSMYFSFLGSGQLLPRIPVRGGRGTARVQLAGSKVWSGCSLSQPQLYHSGFSVGLFSPAGMGWCRDASK